VSEQAVLRSLAVSCGSLPCGGSVLAGQFTGLQPTCTKPLRRRTLNRPMTAAFTLPITLPVAQMGARSDTIHSKLQIQVNHGTDHRGQITTSLQQLDAKPAEVDESDRLYRERSLNP